MDEMKRQENESLSQYRLRYRKAKGLGVVHKKGSAKARNSGRDTGTCLCCSLDRLSCTCSGHMSEDAHKRYAEEQKKRPTPKQSIGLDIK